MEAAIEITHNSIFNIYSVFKDLYNNYEIWKIIETQTSNSPSSSDLLGIL